MRRFTQAALAGLVALGALTAATTVRSTPPSEPTQIVAGSAHTCVLRADGAAECWGRNAWGEAEPPAEAFVELAATDTRTCGLKTDGSVTCWGAPLQLRSEDPTPGPYIHIRAHGPQICGLNEAGALACWGKDWHTARLRFPDTVASTGGIRHQCLLRSDGTVACWGGAHEDRGSIPADRFEQIEAGAIHTCGVTDRGAIRCWGSDEAGQSSPPGGRFTSVCSGAMFSCGLIGDGSVRCWGDGGEGQTTPPEGRGHVLIGCGEAHACAAHRDGQLHCWGRDDWGQALGEPLQVPDRAVWEQHVSETRRTLAAAAGPTAEPAHTQVAAGIHHSCALRSDGTVHCWGRDAHGEASPPEGTFTQVTAGEHYSCGLRDGGAIECWGEIEAQEELWRGPFTHIDTSARMTCGVRDDGSMRCFEAHREIPTLDVAGVVEVSAGGGPECRLTDDGVAVCPGTLHERGGDVTLKGRVRIAAAAGQVCGLDEEGYLACTRGTRPMEGLPAGAFIDLSIGYQLGCALAEDGSVACWRKAGDAAQPPADSYLHVDCGSDHCCGATATGEVRCWGDDEFGKASPGGDQVEERRAQWRAEVLDALRAAEVRAHHEDASYVAPVESSVRRPGCRRRLLAAGTVPDQPIHATFVSTPEGQLSQQPPPNGTRIQADPWSYCVTEPLLGRPLLPWGEESLNIECTWSFDPPSYTFGCAVDFPAGPETFEVTHEVALHELVSHGLFLQEPRRPVASCSDEQGWSEPPEGPFTSVATGFKRRYRPRSEALKRGPTQTSCALREDGSVACWDACYRDLDHPVEGTFVRLTAGTSMLCGLTAGGAATCWDGRLQPVITPDGPFSEVVCTAGGACGLRQDGSASCWGDRPPAPVPEGTFTQITGGSSHACGLRDDGRVECWGSDSAGQLHPPDVTFTEVQAGGNYSCGLRDDGTVECWGYSVRGVVLPGAGPFATLGESSGAPLCGIDDRGRATCWGCNAGWNAGELTCESPCAPPDARFIAVHSSSSHSCGTTHDGAVRCWGYTDRSDEAPGARFVLDHPVNGWAVEQCRE